MEKEKFYKGIQEIQANRKHQIQVTLADSKRQLFVAQQEVERLKVVIEIYEQALLEL
jgi:hypothetical protein